jgi:hypothetical protein
MAEGGVGMRTRRTADGSIPSRRRRGADPDDDLEVLAGGPSWPERLLAAQHLAGNAAVTSALRAARHAPVTVQRDPPAMPDSKKKALTPAEAGSRLTYVRNHAESTTNIIAAWITYIVDKVKPTAGTVRGTYVSSFDMARRGFSISRNLPEVPDLVVHAHYQRDKDAPRAAAVNSSQVKWANDEAGDAPPGKSKVDPGNILAILGANHVDVALDAWEANPDRHAEREKAKEFERKKWVKTGRKEAWGDDASLGQIMGF